MTETLEERRDEWVALLAEIAAIDPAAYEKLVAKARVLALGYVKQN